MPDQSSVEGLFGTATVIVTRADGTARNLRVLVADTVERYARGLSGIIDPDLRGFDGMIFVFPRETRTPVSMKNMAFALAVVFIGSDELVQSVVELEPVAEGDADYAGYLPSVPFRRALEIPLSRIDDVGIAPGASIELAEEST